MSEPSAGPDIVTIETPEHVVVQYEVAGLMSRGLAVFLDHLLQLTVAIILFLVVIVAGGFWSLFEGGGAELGYGIMAIISLGVFVLFWGYFVFFEIFWRGQTPGKWVVGIRVIRDGGYGVTVGSVLVRNLFRYLADLGPFYPLGVVVMFMNRRAKRLGDYVGGTMVVRDQPASLRSGSPIRIQPGRIDDAMVAELRRAGIHRLRPEHLRLVDDFLMRRDEFDPSSRMGTASLIADPIARSVSLTAADPERFLEHVKVALMREERP